jgi:hypothetical protein
VIEVLGLAIEPLPETQGLPVDLLGPARQGPLTASHVKVFRTGQTFGARKIYLGQIASP